MKKLILFCMTPYCCISCNKYPLEIGLPPTLVFIDEATKSDTIIIQYNDYYNDMWYHKCIMPKRTGSQVATLHLSTNIWITYTELLTPQVLVFLLAQPTVSINTASISWTMPTCWKAKTCWKCPYKQCSNFQKAE